MDELVKAITAALEDCELVLGWARDPATGAGRPERFTSAGQAQEAIFDATCVHNLAVHLPRLKQRRVGIVVKGCDARSVVELVVEREVERERVQVIGVGCDGVLDLKRIWRRHGYGVAIEDDGETLLVDGSEVERQPLLQHKCRHCLDADPSIYDVVVGGRTAEGPEPRGERQELAERFREMTPSQRRDFWRRQFARCIRCYACREACPMCFCRDVCIMQTQVPHWAGGEVNPKEAEMIQLIRVGHLAGRCTGCGECERACPVEIPLMLLMEEQNRALEEMLDYRAGTDIEARPPLLTFDPDRDLWGDE